MTVGDILNAEAADEIGKGELVKLIAVPFDGNGSPDAVCVVTAEEGELTKVTAFGTNVKQS